MHILNAFSVKQVTLIFGHNVGLPTIWRYICKSILNRVCCYHQCVIFVITQNVAWLFHDTQPAVFRKLIQNYRAMYVQGPTSHESLRAETAAAVAIRALRNWTSLQCRLRCSRSDRISAAAISATTTVHFLC